MKKVYSLLIILIVLSLLDGTPIHNLHGKFISVRSKSALHQASGVAIMSVGLDHDATVDDSSDDDFHLTLPARIERPLAFQRSLLLKSYREYSQALLCVPLYTRDCNYRM